MAIEQVQIIADGASDVVGNIPNDKVPIRSVAIVADTWGGSTSAALEGSLDGIRFFPLEDNDGELIVTTINKHVVLKYGLIIRVTITSFSGSAGMYLQYT